MQKNNLKHFVALIGFGMVMGILLFEISLRAFEKISLKKEQFNSPTAMLVLNLPKEVTSRLDESILFNLNKNIALQPDPRYLYRVKKGENTGCYTGINSEGFRFEKKSEENKLKIQLVGDSCIFGACLCNFQDTFAPQLTRELKKLGIDAYVMNYGQPGFSTEQMRVLATTELIHEKTDVLILAPGWNDLWSSKITDRELLDEAAIATQEDHLLFLKVAKRAIFRLASRSNKKYSTRVPLNFTLENIAKILSQSTAPKKFLLASESANKHENYLPNPATLNNAVKDYFARDAIFLSGFGLLDTDYCHDGFHPNKSGVNKIAQRLARAIVDSQKSH